VKNAPTGLPGSYAFGRFRLSADGRLLLRDGIRVAVGPKVLHTLLVLVERAGEVVGKTELIQAVWPDSFVEEIGLTRNISILRQALGAEGQRFVVTGPSPRTIARARWIRRFPPADISPTGSSETTRPRCGRA
jgi:DNA-binding response OmpR family regulator